MICDPSHISGKREYIQEVSQQAMDLSLIHIFLFYALTESSSYHRLSYPRKKSSFSGKQYIFVNRMLSLQIYRNISLCLEP